MMSIASAFRRMIGSGATLPGGETPPGNETGSGAQPFVITISHNLGRDEATRRIKDGLTQLSATLAENKVVVASNTWTDDKGDITVRAIGQTVAVYVQVFDDLVRLEARLPWMLAALAEKARGAIERRGTLMLEKKSS